MSMDMWYRLWLNQRNLTERASVVESPTCSAKVALVRYSIFRRWWMYQSECLSCGSKSHVSFSMAGARSAMVSMKHRRPSRG